MNASPSALLIDTNVWIDNYDGTRSGNSSARALLDFAISHNIELLFSPGSIKDVYYLVAASLKIQERTAAGTVSEQAAAGISQIAWGCVENMSLLGTVVPFDTSDLWIARKLKSVHADFEDNMVLAAAQRAKADYLVTNDARLLRDSPVPALSPEKMLNFLTSFAS